MATIAYVAKLPNCDYCNILDHKQVPAKYDAPTIQGPWASMCHDHWVANRRSSELGTGKGQEYVVGNPPADDKQARFNEAAEQGDIDGMMEAVGDGDPADFF